MMKRKNKTNHIPAQCKICGHWSPSYAGLATHLRNTHHITPKEYFDIYIEPFEHKCVHCGSSNVKFINARLGYAKLCGKHDCSIKESKKTRLQKYGDENYNNREQFKQTIKQNKENDPEWLNKIIEKQQKTRAKHIEEDLNFVHKSILKARKTKKRKYGDEFYNGKEKREKTLMENFGVINVFQIPAVKEKCKQSHIKNLGVDHPMKSQKCKDKRVQTYRKNYGVDNPSQLKSNRDQAKQTTADRYGDPNYRNIEQQKKTNAKKTKEQKQAIVKKRKATCLRDYGVPTPLALYCGVRNISKLSLRVQSILDQHNISYEMEYKITSKDGKSKFYDFKFGNIILEINGDYYHANPRFYNENDKLTIHHITYKAKEIWYNDLLKKQLAESVNLMVKYIWEYDMKKLTDDELYQWLLKNVLM